MGPIRSMLYLKKNVVVDLTLPLAMNPFTENVGNFANLPGGHAIEFCEMYMEIHKQKPMETM